MKLIILTGVQHCGKTTSLNRLAEKISNSGGDCRGKTILGNPKQNDWEYDFLIHKDGKDIQLVVSTWGDYWWTLKQCCEKYRSYDAVVCACNLKFMHGRVYKPFEDAMKFDPYATIVMKVEESDINRHKIANETCADYLLELIKYFGII